MGVCHLWVYIGIGRWDQAKECLTLAFYCSHLIGQYSQIYNNWEEKKKLGLVCSKKSSKISINHFYVKDWLFTLMTDGEWEHKNPNPRTWKYNLPNNINPHTNHCHFDIKGVKWLYWCIIVIMIIIIIDILHITVGLALST